MPLVDREGRFRASAIEAVLRDAKEGSQAVMVGVQFSVDSELQGSEWNDWPAGVFSVYGNFCAVKKDGTINETGADQLACIGFTGNLEDLSGIRGQCQITVKRNEYDDKVSYRAEWIDPYDHEGGMRAAEPAVAASLNAQHASKFRAYFGAQKPHAAPPAGSPKSPPPASAAKTNGKCTKDEAWAAFTALRPNAQPAEHADLGNQWLRVMAELIGTKNERDYTPDDWQKMKIEGPSMVIPF